MPAQKEEFETHHLTCPVRGSLPGTTCVDSDFHELPEVHPSRRMTISGRNSGCSRDGSRRSWPESSIGGKGRKLHCLRCSTRGCAQIPRPCAKRSTGAARSAPELWPVQDGTRAEASAKRERDRCGSRAGLSADFARVLALPGLREVPVRRRWLNP